MPRVIPTVTPSLVERILSRCEFADPPEDPLATPVVGPCWSSTAVDAHGYGYVSFSRGMWKASRVMYTYDKGNIHGEMLVDHLCRNRACVNPAHLELVTRRENALRGISAKNIRNHRCAECLSTDGVVIQYKIGTQAWTCRPCAKIKRDRLAEARNAKRRERRMLLKDAKRIITNAPEYPDADIADEAAKVDRGDA